MDEALRLMQMSKFSLYSDERQRFGLDAILDIYSILRDEAARANKMDVSYAQALNRISRMVSFLFIFFCSGMVVFILFCGL
ncbi:putative DNA helicase [Helianthus anomalus]